MEPDSRGPQKRAGPTRSSGILQTAHAAGCSDHACWAYTSRAERDAAAVEWLVTGARIGQRLFIVTADADGGAQLLAAVAAADTFVAQEVAYFSIEALYDLSVPIDPQAQLATYSAEVARAVAEGRNGVRVFCDITRLIADPARRASHAHWEHFADAWMAEGNPLAALCAYDVAVVGDQPEAVMVLHPLRHGPGICSTPFGLFCESSKTVLDGEVDAFGTPALAGALAALPEGPVTLDVSGLSYLCARAAATLADAARPAPTHQPRLRLAGARPIVQRIWQVLGLDEQMLSRQGVHASSA